MEKKANQTATGKAFEYALLNEFFERLSQLTNVVIIENIPFETAKNHYLSFSENEQSKYNLTASFAINFLIDLEPCLSNGINKNDILQLEIVSDKQGQEGDVRDVLAIRLLQKWEIGVSAKNNHRAVKHSRLSKDIDFGQKWLGIACSKTYMDEIGSIMQQLAKMRTESKATKLWSSLGDYHTSVYLPVLTTFKEELMRLYDANGAIVAQRLVEYLIGNKDFYKIIKSNKGVEIQAYNIQGTLSQPFNSIKPKAKVSKLKLPSRILDIAFGEGSKAKTTLTIIMDEGWQISFRIHNASSRIEPSLKFDINLESSPKSLFTNHLFITNG